MAGLLDNLVFFNPYTHEVTSGSDEEFDEEARENPPLPARAVQQRQDKKTANRAAALSGLGVIDWEEVQGHIDDWYARGKQSALAKFVLHFRLTSKVAGDASIRDCFYAGNEKTKKERTLTGRTGLITGLSLFPHYYPNLLNAIPDVFLDDKGAVEMPQYETDSPAYPYYHALGDEMRSFFNAFDGEDKKLIEEQTGVPRDDQLNFCVNSSPWCRSTCLVLSGNHPGSTPGVAKKANLTQALLTHPAIFVAGLYIGMDQLAKAQAESGIDVVARLNMLSDIPWYAVCPKLLEKLADPKRGSARVYWYDYTKIPFWRAPEYQRLGEAIGLTPGQVLDLTFSFSGEQSNTLRCQDALSFRNEELGYPDGIRVAMAFAPANPARVSSYGGKRQAYGKGRTTWREIVEKGAKSGLITKKGKNFFINLPEIGKYQLVDGDGSDYRVDDPGGCIVALNFKNPLITEAFVPGWDARLGKARERFTAKVPDIEGIPTLAPEVLPSFVRKPGLPLLQEDQHFSTGDAPEALAKGEIQFPMFQVGDLLIGPHVPTILDD